MWISLMGIRKISIEVCMKEMESDVKEKEYEMCMGSGERMEVEW